MTTTEQLSRGTTFNRAAVATLASQSSTVLAVRGVVVVAAVVAAVSAVSIAAPSRAGAAAGHGVQSNVLWQTSADGTDYVFGKSPSPPAAAPGGIGTTGDCTASSSKAP
jgi:hypothetical protein